jgi:hypothetical protein
MLGDEPQLVVKTIICFLIFYSERNGPHKVAHWHVIWVTLMQIYQRLLAALWQNY